MINQIGGVAICGLLTLVPTISQELTLKDFNTPSPTTVIREALSDAGIGIEAWSLVLVANDDCDLGWTDDQLEMIIWNVNLMRSITTPENGEPMAAFDVLKMSEQWTAEFSRGNRVAQMALCDPLKRASRIAQSNL